MKLSLKNIGKIAEASVEINGITVIAGENDTGKSTVGKTLFAVFNSFYELQNQIYQERIRSIMNVLQLLYYDIDYRNVDSPQDIHGFITDILREAELYRESPGHLVNPVKKFGVRKKIYDSIIILTDILNQGISQLRPNFQYILVYNDSANAQETDVQRKKSYVQSSASFDRFAKNISKMANKEYVCFGIKIFENYCFKKVHTYTEKEFEQFLAMH